MLSPFQIIYSVRAVFGQARYMADFKEFLLNCKKLNVLHIRLPQDDDGRYTRGHSWIDESDGPGVKLAPLEKLVLEFPSFHNSDRQLLSSTIWDWSRIRHIEVVGNTMMPFLRSMQGQISSLETLVVERFNFLDQMVEATRVLDEFVCSLKGLRVLKLLVEIKQLPVSSLWLHGETLTTLSLRNPSRPIIPGSRYGPRWQYSPEDIGILQNFCSCLSSLDLNMAIVDEMVSFRSCTSQRVVKQRYLYLYSSLLICSSREFHNP